MAVEGLVTECLCWLDKWGATMFGSAGALVALTAAVYVTRAAPPGRAKRRLAAVLYGEAAFMAAVTFAWPAHFALYAPLAVLYLFLLTLLPSPLVRWIRGRERALLVAAVTLPLVAYGITIATMRGPGMPWPLVLFFVAILASLLAASVLGLLAAVDSLRRAPRGTPERGRAKAFLWAFGLRDAVIVVFLLGGPLLGWIFDSTPPGAEPAQGPGFVGWLGWNWFQVVPAIGVLLYVPVLTYGLLRAQIFDIDLKLKRGIEGGTILAIFAVAFFIAEEIGQLIVSQRAGPYVGLAGAGLVALAIVPLRRFAHRVAGKAMPAADGSAEYLSRRKLEVYRAAVEGAYEDGEITDKERAMLNRLAAELVIGPHEMARIEDDVRVALSTRDASESRTEATA